ncbi:transporter substrate-binding domain-containing protein [Gephyromycinifex aptenodytis]|uniref:transporter substrate-binding domain-containing protein n=1 Tax=Gephyromycinifex aptenodytis TaxID=2716227 RepID=UPI0014469362|nr:transporter substrate-binding domain-containing protein [Gephyromycinifex aptenodytis]
MSLSRVRLIPVITAAVGALVLAGCGGGDKPADSDAAATGSASEYKLVKDGTLTVCTHMAYKPFQFNDGGKIVGFDVDIMDLVAKKMGVTQQIVDVPFDQIWSGTAFQAGKCDVGAAGMTITPERANSVLLSEGYFDATQALLVKKGSGLTNLAQLKGKNLGVQTDTTGQKYGEENKEANGYTTVVFDDLPLSVNAVKAGRVDAAINDNGVLYDFAKDNPDTEVVAEFNTGEEYGIAAKKDDPDAKKIIDLVNSTVEEAKSDGTYDEIYKKWFGTTPEVSQDGGTTQAPAAEETPQASASAS